jgi:hypothetical protein
MANGAAITTYAIGGLLAAAALLYEKKKKTKKDEPSNQLQLLPAAGLWKVSGTTKKPAEKREINILAGTKYFDNNPTWINLQRKTGEGRIRMDAGTDGKGSISIEAGKSGNADSNIVLTVGKSSITILDGEIQFKSPSFVFKDGTTSVAQIAKAGSFFNEGDLTVANNLNVTKELSAENASIAKTMSAKTVESGDAKLGSPPSSPSASPKPEKPKKAKTWPEVKIPERVKLSW